MCVAKGTIQQWSAKNRSCCLIALTEKLSITDKPFWPPSLAKAETSKFIIFKFKSNYLLSIVNIIQDIINSKHISWMILI